jgi:PhoD-like phosphatase
MTGGRGVPALLLGPLLRYTDQTAATIWVETDRACTVGILGREAQTFEVAGHHYALVVLEDLEPGSAREYQVALDGTVAWPEPGSAFGPSVLRTLDPGRPARLLFGSCRVAEHEPGHGPDALAACAAGLRQTPPRRWPDALLLIGDQVYADNPGPRTRQFIEQRRAPGASGATDDPAVPPLDEIADFAEYCVLYREAWSDPAVRWLLSVVSTSMIFDDHDFHDDWNTSAAWRSEFAAMPWWRARIEGAYMSYWIYQHLGNLSPAELGKDEVWRQVREGGDAAAVLADMAVRADQRDDGVRWSFPRTFGRVLVVVIDSRSRRVLDGTRRMADDALWRWVTESVRGEWDHVVLATSLPLLLPRGIHALEAWDEAVCGGIWGGRAARAAERLRRAVDLEHWAAFGASFAEFERLLSGLATGAHGTPPASVTVIAGDVHHSYLAPVNLRAGPAARSAVYEAVCSPIHNTLPRSWRMMHRLASSRAGALGAGAVARLAGVRGPRIRWRITAGPWFDNMLAALTFDGRAARVRFDRAVLDSGGAPSLAPVHETELS